MSKDTKKDENIIVMNDIDLSSAIIDKIEKNNAKYPVDKAKGCNKKYNEYK